MILLEGTLCYLRSLKEQDAEKFTSLLKANERYWTIYEPKQEARFYTVRVQKQRIKEALKELQNRREYNFGIFDSHTGKLIGHISLYSVKRMPFSSGFVGYSIDENETGRGIGTDALRLVRTFAFDALGLHRLEAYVSPRNVGSIAVLEKAGFTQEGYLRKLLFIIGVWEDHYLYAMIEDDF